MPEGMIQTHPCYLCCTRSYGIGIAVNDNVTFVTQYSVLSVTMSDITEHMVSDAKLCERSSQDPCVCVCVYAIPELLKRANPPSVVHIKKGSFICAQLPNIPTVYTLYTFTQRAFRLLTCFMIYIFYISTSVESAISERPNRDIAYVKGEGTHSRSATLRHVKTKGTVPDVLKPSPFV